MTQIHGGQIRDMSVSEADLTPAVVSVLDLTRSREPRVDDLEHHPISVVTTTDFTHTSSTFVSVPGLDVSLDRAISQRDE